MYVVIFSISIGQTFIYRTNGTKLLVMRFERSKLIKYVSNTLQFPQKFAQFAFKNQRLSEESYNIISRNLDFEVNA